MTARQVVAVVGIGVLAVVIAAMLLHSGPRRSGTDRTPDGSFVLTLGAGQQTCQEGELLPADTAALRMTIGTYGTPGPPLKVSVLGASGAVLTRGGLAAGWKQGIVSIPVRHVSHAQAPVRVCLTDAQPAGPGKIAIAGTRGEPGASMSVDGAPEPGVRVRIDYMRPGRETWLQMLPTLAHRLSLGKSALIRGWAWIGAPLLMLLAIGLALRVAFADAPAGEERQS